MENDVPESLNELSSPPRPQLAFRIGVVGHRPNRLHIAETEILQDRLEDIVTAIRSSVEHHHVTHREMYDEGLPVIRALTPLAEGVDRLFANAALAGGCQLAAVLPFARKEYQKDFCGEHSLEEQSLATFEDLLGKADGIFELDGKRGAESYAYHVAGDVILNQSDVLIVVWDGIRKNKRGGTEQTLDDALEREVPVIWIDAQMPHHWKLITSVLQIQDAAGQGERAELKSSDDNVVITEKVERLLNLPQYDSGPSHSDCSEKLLEAFYRETRPEWHWGICWQWFRDLIAKGRLVPPSPKVQSFEEQLREEGDWGQVNEHPVERSIASLRPFFAWPDQLASLYADGYRSAFVAAYFLAAFSVAMALGAVGLHLKPHSVGELIFAGLELLMIVTILFLVIRGRRASWHRRWLDYRLLAEMIRHQRLVSHLGGQRVTPNVPDHLGSYGDPGASWMAWYSRAVERWLGLPTAVVDRDYLARSLEDQLSLLESQFAFHEINHIRSERIEHRLHLLEMLVLGLTLVCCLQHLAQGIWHDWPQLAPGYTLIFFCGFFPALGAALAGISNQAEFRRVSQRSRSMRDRLSQDIDLMKSLLARLDSTESLRQLSPDIARAADSAAQTMVNEVLDWRVIFQDQPLKAV